MKRLDSLIIWLILIVLYIIGAYIYNKRFLKKQGIKERVNFFKCIFFLYSKNINSNCHYSLAI